MNVSAQAISKWEKDMSEPDLASLRILADFYKVSVDDLLDPNVDLHSTPQHDNAEKSDTQSSDSSAPIGFCKMCGLVVKEDNVGARSPVVLCRDCKTRSDKQRSLAAAAEARAKEQEQRKVEFTKIVNSEDARKRLIWSISIALLVLALGLAIGLPVNIPKGGSAVFGTVICSVLLTTFTGAMFFDCYVRDVLFDWTSKSFRAPGLIFTFDLDGFMWLIGMKILFWIIGIIFSIVVAVIGFIIALVISPFVYIYVITNVVSCIKTGKKCDLL